MRAHTLLYYYIYTNNTRQRPYLLFSVRFRKQNPACVVSADKPQCRRWWRAAYVTCVPFFPSDLVRYRASDLPLRPLAQASFDTAGVLFVSLSPNPKLLCVSRVRPDRPRGKPSQKRKASPSPAWIARSPAGPQLLLPLRATIHTALRPQQRALADASRSCVCFCFSPLVW